MTEEIVKIYGNLLSCKSIPEPFRSFYEEGKSLIHNALSSALLFSDGKPEPYPFSMAYPLKGSFNAGTWNRSRQGSIITINASVPYLLFNACAAYSVRVSLTTGLPLHDKDNRLILYASPLSIPGRLGHVSSAAYLSRLFEGVMNNPDYKAMNLPYALFIYDIAMKFFIMHEVMHVVLGHTGYAQKKLKMRHLMEFSSTRDSLFHPLFSQSMEFIADRHSARGVLKRLLEGADTYESQDTLLKGAAVSKDVFLTRAVVTALTLLFHLFPVTDRNITDRNSSHPHPYIRMQWLISELEYEIRGKCDPMEALGYPFSAITATLISNYKTPHNWEQPVKEDNKFNCTGKYYDQILQLTKKWQKGLWEKFSPLYPGDGQCL